MNSLEIIKKQKCEILCRKYNIGAATFPLLWSISNKQYKSMLISLILGIPVIIGFFIAIIYALFAIFLPSKSGFIFIPLLPFLAIISPFLLTKSIPVYMNIIFYMIIAVNIIYRISLGHNANRNILDKNPGIVNKLKSKQGKWAFCSIIKLVFLILVAVLAFIHYPEIF